MDRQLLDRQGRVLGSCRLDRTELTASYSPRAGSHAGDRAHGTSQQLDSEVLAEAEEEEEDLAEDWCPSDDGGMVEPSLGPTEPDQEAFREFALAELASSLDVLLEAHAQEELALDFGGGGDLPPARLAPGLCNGIPGLSPIPMPQVAARTPAPSIELLSFATKRAGRDVLQDLRQRRAGNGLSGPVAVYAH